jgi:preprotein translocase subunit SecF
MYKGFRIISDTASFRFMRMRVMALLLSTIIVLGSLGLIFTKGLNFGIDFTGGMLIEVRYSEAPDLSKMREQLNGLGYGSASLQEFGSDKDILVRFPQNEGVPQQQIEADIKRVLNSFASEDMGMQSQNEVEEEDIFALTEDAPENETLAENQGEAETAEVTEAKASKGIDYRRVEFVGPQVGGELIKAGVMAIIFSILGILAYVSFRFEWQFGVASVAALIHDSLAIVGLFALFQMEFDLATVAAVLMIAGYSINDTVVVFDRVRENLRKFKKRSLIEVIDMSLNQTLARTLLTSMTTLIALIALYVFGGEVIRGFIDALIFGILVGTYSSVFVASPLLLFLGLRAKDVEAPDAPLDDAKVL